MENKNGAKHYYFDNAATTKVEAEVAKLISEVMTENYGNPSSLYGIARDSKRIISEAREKIAQILHCKTNEIYFTSCGSESINWGIKGAAYRNRKKGRHIITSKIEHHAMLNALRFLEKEGFEVTYLDVYENGIVRTEDVASAIREDTILITVMYANNEIGTIQPIKEIALLAAEKNIVFFTDAVQAVGHIDINFSDLGVSMAAFSGHKFGAPKGIGGLYIKNGILLDNLIDGGGQERKKRGGTENTAYIAGLAKALELSAAKSDEAGRITKMRDYIIDRILSEIPYTRLNGDRNLRLPSNANISFEFIEGESLILLLDLAGICASTGSACSSDSLDPSHVLLAIGLPHEIAHGSLRLSIDSTNTYEEIDYMIEKVKDAVKKLRDMSPLYENIENIRK